MSQPRYVEAIIENVKTDDLFIEIKFLRDGCTEWKVFKKRRPTDIYIIDKMMKMCGKKANAKVTELRNHEFDVVVVCNSIVAIRGDDDTEFYPMPATELYYADGSKVKYTKEELENYFN